MNETLQNFSNIAIALGIFLTAFGGYGSYYFGKRIERQKDADSQAKEVKLTKQIDGLSTSAKALEARLGPFEKLAETLYPNMQIEAAMEKLRQDTLELRKKTDEIEKKAMPRTISSQARIRCAEELRRIVGWKIRIEAAMNDQESFAFADSLAELFRASGWEVDGVHQVVWTKPVFGAFLFAGGSPPSPEANIVAQALVGNGLPLKPVAANDVGAKQLVLQIGAKE